MARIQKWDIIWPLYAKIPPQTILRGISVEHRTPRKKKGDRDEERGQG